MTDDITHTDMTEDSSRTPESTDRPQNKTSPEEPTEQKLPPTHYFSGVQNAVLAYVAAQIGVSLIFKSCAPAPPLALLLSFAPLNLAALMAFLLTLARPAGTVGLPRAFQWTRSSDAPAKRLWFPARLLLMTLATALTAYATHILTRLLNLPNAPQHLVSTLTRCQSPAILIIIAILAIAVAPVTEEILFRLGVNQSLGIFLPPRLQTLLTALIFALAHGQLNTVPSLVVVGLFLQQAKKVGGLKTSIALHSSYNLLQLILIFSIK